MKKIWNLALVIAAGVILLTACGSNTDVNEKNFGKAITQYLDKKGDLYVYINNWSAEEWPIDLYEKDLNRQESTPHGIANQMAALEAAGLVRGEDTEVEIKDWMDKPTGHMVKIKRYTLTDAAKPFIRETTSSWSLNGNKKIELCWGKQALDKIIKWEGPMKLGDYQEAEIIYTYKLNNLADWAKNPELQVAFPEIKETLDGVGNKKIKHAVKLTSIGWEAKGLE